MSTLHTLDWELNFVRSGDIEQVPIEDRERVLHELNELCELARILIERPELLK